MAVRKILYPFAQSGNRRVVPDTSTLSQMAYDTGITYDYERPTDVDAQAKNIDREGWNGLLYDITGNVQAEQLQAYPDWVAPTGGVGDTGYPVRAMVRYNGQRYMSLKDSNMDVPTTAASWELQLKSSDIVARVPAWYKGEVSAAGDFNGAPYATTNGFWDFPSDTVMGQMLNGPGVAQAGYLETRIIPLSAGGNLIIQTLVGRQSNIWVRTGKTYTSTWTAWRYLASFDASLSTIPADYTGAGTAADWNTFVNQAGVMQVFGSNFGAANSPPGVPAGSAGTLEILFGNVRSGIITQICRVQVSGVTQCFTRVRNPAGQWSAWANEEGSTKVNRSGDSMTGRLTFSGPAGQSISYALRMKSPSQTQAQYMRAWSNSGTPEIQFITKDGSSGIMSLTNNGVMWALNRPSWVGLTPWDNANFDPNTKINADGSKGSYGKVFNGNAHSLQTKWNGTSGFCELYVDGSFKGGVWQDRHFSPSQFAPKYANCHRNSGRFGYGPIANGIAYEVNQPQVCTGVGSNNGNSTANNIYFSGRYARNN
ncbi:hypothetical protein [Burkholderia phage BCSR129]|nr:hypothetical protein [Burkholderia phage BCSR129]